MRLVYAFVADAAQFTPDGKLYVLGGDFQTISSRGFPSVHPIVTLAVKLEVQLTECGIEHRLRVVLLDMDGREMQGLEVGFNPQPDRDRRHRPVGVGMAFNFVGLEFPRAGDYAFHVMVDNLEVGVIPIYVVERLLDPQQPTLPEPQN